MIGVLVQVCICMGNMCIGYRCVYVGLTGVYM